MSDETRTGGYVLRMDPQGGVAVSCYEKLWTNLHARYAYAVLPYILQSEGLRSMMSDEGSNKPSPKRVASYACDVAQQLMDQFRERGWLLELPPPVLSDTERAAVAEVTR